MRRGINRRQFGMGAVSWGAVSMGAVSSGMVEEAAKRLT
jgi:hypothetical protein